MTQEEQYKSFIKYCTKAGKSISNYSDFKRINETIAKIKGVEKYDIYSCVHTKELQDMIDLLYENEEFKAYNTKGGNQYSNALETYLKFLHAKEIFTEETKPKYSPILSLQQIYYGAPGTGKSKAIKDLTFGESVIRTTFHPDSDYASFVGTYKPITEEVDLRDCYGKKVIDDDTKEVVKEERIAYKFIPQAFLEAYVEAWKKLGSGKKQYLIIEEINRGNCAQIFGDLFQLLDRNEYGFSDYPIVADKDMQKYLEKEFAGWEITNKDEINQLFGEANMVNLIMKGERLVLPSNLYIWATMNTSDQSLFPIDSAFKRRWDWKYVPIREGRDKETNAPLNWYINTGDKQYKWWSFISKVNELIGSLTNSEDKKLGYFFCKAKDGEIDADLFVSKVIFYLWNDVFKDYGFDDKDFQDEEGKILSFDRFYEDKKGITNVDIAIVEQFLDNLGVEKASFNKEEEDVDDEDSIEEEESSNSTTEKRSRDNSHYTINGRGDYKKGPLALAVLQNYTNRNPTKTVKEIMEDWAPVVVANVPHMLETQEEYNTRTSNSKDKSNRSRANIVKWGNNNVIYISTEWNIDTFSEFIQKVNAQDWGINIEKIEE